MDLQQFVRQHLTIPTLPEVVLRINEVMAQPDTGCAEIGALVAEDAPLAAKVLRLANSAYYGLAGRCGTTEHAATVLGIRVMRTIVMQVSVMGMYDHLDGGDAFSVRRLWEHASLTGHLSSRIARKANVPGLRPDEFFVCGLLHDVGKVVLLDGLGASYLELVKRSTAEGTALHHTESQELGFDHSQVGALLARRWELPKMICEAIELHHAPTGQIDANQVVSLVAHADVMAHRVEDGEPLEDVFDPRFRDLFGLLEHDVAELVEFAQDARRAA